MTEEQPHEPIAPEESRPAPEAPVSPKRSVIWRAGGRLLAVLVAIVAALIVTFLTIDLGPYLKGVAEREGSKYLERPLHIGRISARMTPGEYVVEDLVIEGLTPTSRPFLTAKRIYVKLPWWTAITRKITIEAIEMTDWDMYVETFPGGKHNFPKVTPKGKRQGPKRFTTTARSVRATRGRFTYEDHGVPWSIVAPNLTVGVYRGFDRYLGTADFSSATVSVQQYERFGAQMRSRFAIDGSKLHFSRLDLITDGAVSVMDGDIDFSQWPEQIYRVKSRIDFPTQKNIFFHKDRFTVSGQGDFEGTYKLFKRGGFELQGRFSSDVAGVNEWRFPNLRGQVRWVPPGHLAVTNATSGLYGGTARFDYVLGPSKPREPTPVVWKVAYQDVDLVRLTDFLELRGIRLSGRISGRNNLQWTLGHWAEKRGEGEVTAQPPPGIDTMPRELTPAIVAARASLPPEAGPFNPHTPLGHVPVSGRIVYKIDPAGITLDRSWTATPKTYVEFEGRTAFGERSRIPFHVTSVDWQESDRVLAGIMTAFGSPTGAVELGGVGEFDGVMLNSFSRPRIEGKFRGDHMRAWDVVWGRGGADVVIENGYVVVKDGRIAKDDSEIVANGQFSLGYPRRDGGEELNARVRITRRPMKDLRHAFELDDYPVDGLVSGEYHLYGGFETPHGFGKLVIDNGVAYGEPFDTATASLRFEGTGVRLDAIDIKKGTGSVTGAAWVAWDGNYSFNADGSRIPVESLELAKFPRAPLSGMMRFNASGTGTFDVPRYDVKVNVDDLFAGDEGIGQLVGRIGLRGEMMTLELEAASPRLQVSGSGRIALTPEMDAELTLRFGRTSLDPYLRFFEPRLSPYTRAVAGGTVRVVGELADVDHLQVETRVEDVDLTLFDYRITNIDPRTGKPVVMELALDNHVARIDQARLFGEGTELQLGGSVSLHDSTIDVQASGDANLGILQGFFRNLRSSGTAVLKASVNGPLSSPTFSGSASIANGRIRHFSLPHSLEAINGGISFDADGIRVNDVMARLGGGEVRFGGRIGMNGFVPGELNLTADGDQMQIRYPEGFKSIVAANLRLVGDYRSPELNGRITVHDALWSRRFETNLDLFSSRGEALPTGAAPATTTLPVRFDLQIDAPSTLRIENNIARMTASADLRLQGTYDRPQLFGRAEIERGDVIFEGNRYVVTRGTMDFSNPARIEPYIDVEAETRVRAADQTYRITLGFTGTTNNMSMVFNADPPLPMANIFQLLLGQTTDVADADIRALNPQTAAQSEAELLRSLSGRLLTSPISAPVGRVVEQTLGFDTVQITPSIGNENDPLAPSMRLTIGKRLSNRAYLTFARALGTVVKDQIVVLEYDQNERVGWILTQTGDRTFAVDFRVRHRF
jgi:translocation-and-assembly-module (TAM) inner membrane subunit TamB-like protein